MVATVYLQAGVGERAAGVRGVLADLLAHADLAGLVRGEQVLVKPNCVSSTRQLAATHADALAPVLAALALLGPRRIILGEGSAEDTRRAFKGFGYTALTRRYGVELLDLNRDRSVALPIYDERGQAHPVRVAKTALDSVRVSVALPKTHDTVIVTASFKNMVVGCIQKPDKAKIHRGYRAINVNLALLGRALRPHLAVIDGFVGMEGDGPVDGEPVDHRVAFAGTDPVAVDAVAADLMGFAPGEIGYLVHAARLGLGEVDLGRITVQGADLAAARRRYRPHRTYGEQRTWDVAGTPLAVVLDQSAAATGS
ncbi:MAG: DUF362 domain-containing protein [Candidatus Acetothermia bacterium]|jgi:uncharacterized protein (DUF362 family)|nr:DUF362 domain-containing protein [Candidatus Acetothermia bacterium]